MGSALGLQKLVRWCVGLLFLAGSAQMASASVVNGNYSLGGTRQGSAGQDVSFIVREPNLQGYEGAELLFTFDSTVLSFLGASTTYGTALPLGLSDVNGTATYALSLTTDTGPLSGSYDLFTLIFNINAGAALGETPLEFTNFASAPFEPGIYDRPSLSGTINVVAAVPIVGTLPLAATALVLLALVKRRRGDPRPGPARPGA